jgi:uncharacterized protein (DUF1697 family)
MMNTYIALLRGINVSGKNSIKMADLKEVLMNSGFDKVVTYIQSGNIIVETNQDDKLKIAATINQTIKESFGFDVPVLVLDRSELISFLKEYPFTTAEDSKQYFVFLFSKPDNALAEKLSEQVYEGEEYLMTDRMIFLNPSNGYGNAKLNNNLFENKLKVTATTRNLKTVNMLIELSK